MPKPAAVINTDDVSAPVLTGNAVVVQTHKRPRQNLESTEKGEYQLGSMQYWILCEVIYM